MKIKNHSKRILLAVAALLLLYNVHAQMIQLSLQQALEQAAKGNRSLLIRTLEFQRSETAASEARTFQLPELSLNSSYYLFAERPVIYLRNEAATPKLDDVKFGGRYAFLAALQASYPLITPAIRSNIQLKGTESKLKKEEIKNTEETIALEISKLYLGILLQQEQRNVITQSLQRNELALQDSRQLFYQGRNLKSDTLSKFIAVQDLRASLSDIHNNLVVLLQQLKQLLGLPSGTTVVLTDSLEMEFRKNGSMVGEDLSRTVAARTDIRIQGLQLDRSKDMLENTKAAFKPRLKAIASYQLQAQSDHPQVWNYTFPRSSYAGVMLDIPLYSGKRLSHQVKQSTLQIRQDELALAELESAAQTEIITLRANQQKAWNRWQIQQQNVAAAQISYDMSLDRYRHGLGTRLELTDAELALTKSRLGILESIFQLQLTALQLKKASGTLVLDRETENKK